MYSYIYIVYLFLLFQVLDTSKEHRPITLMIMPVFLVPDTNCFIDNLAGIQQLVSSKRFTLVIPLVGEYLKAVLFQTIQCFFRTL